MGAFAVQLKQIAAGLGIFRDDLYSGFADPNRSGHRFGTTLLGPAFSPVNLVLNIVRGSSTPQREAVEAFKCYLVPGSSLWYVRVGGELSVVMKVLPMDIVLFLSSYIGSKP
ncbi:hypothetical protein [Kiloniella sp. b19]|uniref:hypothetical protein n=1 Tax=Kiloniella sp. GXU_MW_B19 TaxID=3141326 RepID=UPI0031CEEB1A